MSDNKTISFSVLSGKGGVGKSNLALNLCCALHQMGHSVLLMDCDMGLANMDVLLGIAPQSDIQDILINNRDPSSVLVPIDPAGKTGFDLLPANSGMAEFVDLDTGARALLRDRLNPLAARYDFLCLDIGAGISSTALGFGAMTSLRLVVVTPEPTSLTDSYAMIKVMMTRHSVQDFFILVNQVESDAEAKQTYNRLAGVCQRFLNFAPAYLGQVRFDRTLVEAVRKQIPLMQLAPRSPASVDCANLASLLRRQREMMLKQGHGNLPLTPRKLS
ncbi:MAG: MinD/ParA family protein [Desulfovibrio sp.]|jgi:flagellar biosynthesis protein FlhG|nr:MinD/ParA family protein [Desulfovibrio sp.]